MVGSQRNLYPFGISHRWGVVHRVVAVALLWHRDCVGRERGAFASFPVVCVVAGVTLWTQTCPRSLRPLALHCLVHRVLRTRSPNYCNNLPTHRNSLSTLSRQIRSPRSYRQCTRSHAVRSLVTRVKVDVSKSGCILEFFYFVPKPLPARVLFLYPSPALVQL